MTAVYGLVGKTLDHSFSKSYFTEKFKTLGLINAVYENFAIDNISKVKDIIATKSVKGFNVTIPYKESIIPYLDEVDEVALAVGAVNTVVVTNGKTKGYNTDVFGFKQMIKPFFKSRHQRAIILGTGGASKAIAYVLEELGCDPIYISRYPKEQNQFAYEEINQNMIEACLLIVNTTPVGTFPNVNDELFFPTKFLTEKNLVIDLIYNPAETVLLKKAKAKNAWTLNGLTMLQQQAEKAWEIWNQ
jgi:shikimate dehydrogenase